MHVLRLLGSGGYEQFKFVADGHGAAKMREQLLARPRDCCRLNRECIAATVPRRDGYFHALTPARVLLLTTVAIVSQGLPAVVPGLPTSHLEYNLPPHRSPGPVRRLSSADGKKSAPHFRAESTHMLARRNNALNEVQPTHVPVFSADGFIVIATPEFVQEDLLSVLRQSRKLGYWEFTQHSFALVSGYPNGTSQSIKVDVPHRYCESSLWATVAPAA